MDSTKLTASDLESVEADLREDLAQGDAVLSTATPILRHLLANEDQALFSDEVVARVRGMLSDLARQMLYAQAEAGKIADRAAFAHERLEPLVMALAADGGILGHLHALTIEGQLTHKLHRRTAIDPVLSPLLQELVAAKDEAIAAAAMSAITAQARFVQQQRRMALPLGELPGDLFHAALTAFRSLSEDEAAGAAADALCGSFDESLGRIGLLGRLVMRMGKGAARARALDIDSAGLATFATALAMAARQDRDRTVLSFSDRQFARLALALRAAGLKQDLLEEQFLYLHPGIELPEGFAGVGADRANLLLSDANAEAKR